MQSIVDYSRSLQTTNSAAIDPVFNCSQIIDEGGSTNYPFFWTGTTHASSNGSGRFGIYVCFGEGLGWMETPPGSGNYTLMDVHGAGAQRSDPKQGDPSAFPHGNGPQGDVVRIFNYVRLVRTDSSVGIHETGNSGHTMTIFPNPATGYINLRFNSPQNGKATISIINNSGQIVARKTETLTKATVIRICLPHLLPGVYTVSFSGEDSLFNAEFVYQD